MRRSSRLSWIAGFLLLGMANVDAQTLQHCFTDSQFDGWWRPLGDKTIYIRTNTARYYRLDLTQSCGTEQFPGAHLVFNIHGSNTICSALDFDLRVSQGVGDIAQPCFVKKMSEVSADEAASLKRHTP
jgi:hypothetical protein